MRIEAPRRSYGPLGATTTARIVPDSAPAFDAWFRVPPGWTLDDTSSPFLPVGLALAAVHGEALVVEGTVSARLLEGAHEAAPLLASYHRRPVPRIAAEPAPLRPRPGGPEHVGLFVSRGVDSSTNLVLGDRGDLEPRPTLGIVMAALETANSPEVDAEVTRRSVSVARRFGLDAVVPHTNLRRELDAYISWIDVFGCVLAGAAIALGHQLRHAIISSSGREQPLLLGSHPDLDPLWGTEWLDVHHLPHHLSRPDRVRLLAEDGRALSFLKVCTTGALDNCGRCNKCTQTAAILQVLGVLDRTPVFPMAALDPEALREHPTTAITTPDFVGAVAATEPVLADAVLRDRGRDRTTGQGRPSTTRLNDVARAAGDRPPRPLRWCALGPAGPALARAVDAAAAHGPGLVLAGDGPPPPRPVLDAALQQAEVTFWVGDDEVDVHRIVEVLANGGRPVQVADRAARRVLRAGLPAALRALVASPTDLPEVLGAADRSALAKAVVAGGTGWFGTAATGGPPVPGS